MRIDAIPRRWIAERPDHAAIREADRLVTWRELGKQIDTCAKALVQSGVRAGDRVMIVAENSTPLIAALFATSAVDAAAIAANPRLSARELDAMREHASPRRVLFATGIAAEVDEHARRIGASDIGRGLAMSALDEGAAANAMAADDNAHLAAIVYTTGTSGRPKGVMLTHANLLFVAETSATLRDIGPADRVFGALPIYHVYGLASMLLGSFVGGAQLNVVARFDAQRALDMLARDGLTIFQGVPAMYARMLERLPDGERAHAPSLRYLYAGGSILDPKLKATVEARFGCPLHNGYGLTECSPTVSQTRLGHPRDDTSVGPPIPGVEVKLAPSGELWVRGPNVMRGYYRDPEATADAITPDGWLRTGDLARIGDDGALFIVGRLKELIIRSGLNVHPVEVETVLNAHPDVAQSVVVGRTVADGNEEVVAFVEPKRGRTVAPDALAAHAAGQLAAYKRPSQIVVMDALPASPTGKVLRGKLKDLARQ
jgi:acyl-CoA synthetase (AMP-forming)/AMP-acid ligase II